MNSGWCILAAADVKTRGAAGKLAERRGAPGLSPSTGAVSIC